MTVITSSTRLMTITAPLSQSALAEGQRRLCAEIAAAQKKDAGSIAGKAGALQKALAARAK